MSKRANYTIVGYETSSQRLVIRDLGPWHQYQSVTNAVEDVVRELYARCHLWEGRQLLYYDTAGNLDEILHAQGRFLGFKPFRKERS